MNMTLSKNVKVMCALILLFVCTPFINEKENVYASSPDYIIVLDPGHDNTHSGAHANGYREELLNLKIAQYCKMELEKNSGIKVYMIRDSENCPYGGSGISSSKCNSMRVQFAKKMNADLYISFHIDSASSSARGASVYYPNNNYKPEIGFKGERLAVNILTQLKSVGISQRGRGILMRNSENGTTYPDGSVADYLAVIKGNKQNDIPAVLIEHCFISNRSDCEQFLSSDGKLNLLGRADSIGILNYLGMNDTDIKKAEDGNWYFYRNGNIDYNYTGLGVNSFGWWYVKNGMVDFSANTVAKFKDSYWYIKNGKYDPTYTGVACNQYGDWYVRNGEVDFSFTGLANVDCTQNYAGDHQSFKGWYNFKKGQLIYANDIVANGLGWWYVENGKVNFDKNTVAKNGLGWWYVKDGKVDFNFNGIGRNSNGDWFIQNGKVIFEKTGLVTVRDSVQKIDYNSGETISFGGQYYIEAGKVIYNATTIAYDGKYWWYIKDGKIQENANTIAKNSLGWWYIRDGKVDFGYTGIARNSFGDWYIKNGKVQFEKTGLVQSELKSQTYPDSSAEPVTFEGWYHVKDGQVQYMQTIVGNSMGWWYVGEDGKVDFGFNGIASNSLGTWYLENGKVNFNYNNDEYVWGNKVYSITQGRASEIVSVEDNSTEKTIMDLEEVAEEEDITGQNTDDEMIVQDGDVTKSKEFSEDTITLQDKMGVE